MSFSNDNKIYDDKTINSASDGVTKIGLVDLSHFYAHLVVKIDETFSLTTVFNTNS